MVDYSNEWLPDFIESERWASSMEAHIYLGLWSIEGSLFLQLISRYILYSIKLFVYFLNVFFSFKKDSSSISLSL